MIENLLSSATLVPLNSEIRKISASTNNENCKSDNFWQVRSLKKLDPTSGIGCAWSSISLEQGSTYELFLRGTVSNLPTSSTLSTALTTERKEEKKEISNEFELELGLKLGSLSLKRIQDSTGKIINLLWRFKWTMPSTREHLFLSTPKAATTNFTLLCADFNVSHLYRIPDGTNECVLRRGNEMDRTLIDSGLLPFNDCSRAYSSLHTTFALIYVLHFDDEPQQWIAAKQSLKRIGVTGTRVTMSRKDELVEYTRWKSKLLSPPKMDIDSWCITKKIVQLITTDAIPLNLSSVLFLTTNLWLTSAPNFENIFYEALCKRPRAKLFSLMESAGENTKFHNSWAIGFSDTTYEFIVSHFNSSPISLGELLPVMLNELADEDYTTSSPSSSVGLNSGSPLMLTASCFSNGNSNNTTSTKLDAVLETIPRKHLITMIVTVDRRFFFDDRKLDKLLQLIQQQTYPFWNCILLTTKYTRPVVSSSSADAISTGVTISNPGDNCRHGLTTDRLNDHRFQILELDSVASVNKVSLKSLFGTFFPTRYLLYFGHLDCLKNYADKTLLARKICAFDTIQDIKTSKSVSTASSSAGANPMFDTDQLWKNELFRTTPIVEIAHRIDEINFNKNLTK